MPPIHTWTKPLLASCRIMILLVFMSITQAFAQTAPLVAAQPGTLAPEGITYKGVDGALQIPDYSAAKLTLVHFWSTWCVPCVKELPQVDDIAKTYGPKGLQVIAISLDTKPEKAAEFLKRHHITALEATLDNRMASFRLTGARGLPVSLFISRYGELIARIDGPSEWKEGSEPVQLIESVLK